MGAAARNRAALARAVRRPLHSHAVPKCDSCGKALSPYGRCNRRYCPAYFKTWARDQVQVIYRNIEALGEHHDLITITPPGKSSLPWDEASCAHRGPHKHSGPDGCRVEKRALDRWMYDRDRELTRYLDAAKTRASRATEEPRAETVLTPELQERGAPHWHIAAGAHRRRWNQAFAAALADLAGSYGFGRPKFDPHHHGTKGRLDRYLSKLAAYLGKAVKDGDQEKLDALREALEVYGMRTSRVSPSVTRRTYATMRNHRLKRWGHHRLQEAGIEHRLSCREARELYDSATANRQKYLDGLRLAAAQALEDGDQAQLDRCLGAMNSVGI